MKPETDPDERPLQMIRHDLTRAGASLVCRVGGRGPMVVLIPSLGRGSEDFDTLAHALVASGYRVMLPEPRGIEGTTPLAETDTLHDMAADIAAMIDADRSEPAIIAGHAAGNWVARVLAHDRPDLTRAVVLLAAIVTNTVDKQMRASISASFDMTLSDQDRLGHLARVYFAPGADATVWLDGWWPDVSAAQRRAASQTPDTDWIRVADRHPTLYVGAADDVISPPPRLAALRDTIGPKASCVVIPNAGHALLPEQPASVARALCDWIAGLPDTQG